MIKTHEVIDFISSSIGEAVNPEEIIIVDTDKVDNKLEVTFTEKDMTETKYRVTVELVEVKKQSEKLYIDKYTLSEDDKDIINRNTTIEAVFDDLYKNSTDPDIVRVCNKSPVVEFDVLPIYKQKVLNKVASAIMEYLYHYTSLVSGEEYVKFLVNINEGSIK